MKDILEELNKLNENLSKGIFWILDPSDPESSKDYCFTIPCNSDGIPDSLEGLKSKNGETYNHERYWKALSKQYTHNQAYNYYPRGRVEISHGKATIYLNPNIATPEVQKFIEGQFNLTPYNRIKSVRLFPDGSDHNECYLDN